MVIIDMSMAYEHPIFHVHVVLASQTPQTADGAEKSDGLSHMNGTSAFEKTNIQ